MSFSEVVLEGPRYVTRGSVELYLGTTLVFAMVMLIWNELLSVDLSCASYSSGCIAEDFCLFESPWLSPTLS